MKKILFVDDEAELRDIFKLFFVSSNYNYADASNGELGVEIAKSFKPDLIIMDYKMPVMDGLTALKKLRADKETSDIPVIMYSGFLTDADMAEFKRNKCSEILVKPIEIEVLLAIISKYV